MPAQSVVPRARAGKALPLRQFAHLDALRAGAVMLVVLGHAGLDLVPGGSGVTIFFVISGFIITHLVLKEHRRTGGFDIGGFYRRRALKLLPPLLVGLVVPTALYAWLVRPVNPTDVLGQVFFFFNWRYTDSAVDVLPGSIVVWSLSIEEQFYVGFALVWLLLVGRARPALALGVLAGSAAAASAAARLALHLGGASADRIYFGTDTRLEAIAIGVLAAVWHHRLTRDPAGPGLPGWWGRDAVVVAALGLYLLSLGIREELFRETLRYSLQAVAACLVVLWGLRGPAGPLGRAVLGLMRLRPVQVIGLASYSIYLLHLVVSRGLTALVGELPGPGGVAVHVVLGTGAGLACWWFVEEPVQRWSRRRREAAPAPGPGSVPGAAAPTTAPAAAPGTAPTPAGTPAGPILGGTR
ncbi:acyltransferase [Kocuria sp. LUK]|uniref:acyltransferase family protein n=1 Tax=Kocuria sp. LUK TaxID=2897828 RepID=UPI001E334DCE|nr:acyltransferase [Kocuria sp. LUK]MCD1144900.1 acyltransferase [Kocuria sp. LUK]